VRLGGWNLPRLSARQVWVLLGFALVLQWCLFKQHGQREVAGGYPRGWDQITYLSDAYETYDATLEGGIGKGLSHGLRLARPQGFLLPLEADVLFLLLGPSRVSALTVNFLHFALLQIVLVSTLRWLSRTWWVPAVGVGLLLMACAPFFWVGGLFDFRLDFAATSLYGLFICSVLRSRTFASRRGSIVVGIAGTLCVLTRFITVVYLAAIMGGFLAFLALMQWKSASASVKRRARHRMLGVGRACLVMAVVCLPVLFALRQQIWNYYVVGHVTGQEKNIRAAEQGVGSLVKALLYYPRSVLDVHTGSLFNVFAALLLTLAFIAFFRWRRDGVGKRLEAPGTPAFLLLCVLVPVSILTLDTAKSPVVGQIVYPALLLATLFPVAVIARDFSNRSPAGVPALAALGVLTFGIGLGHQATHFVRHDDSASSRSDAREVVTLYDRLTELSVAEGWSSPRISYAATADYFHPLVLEPIAYERHGVLLQPKGALGATGILAPDESQVPALLGESDFAVIASTPSPLATVFPFDRLMNAMKPGIEAFCAKNFAPVDHFRFFEQEVTLYVRPTLKIEGASGGWITSAGLLLSAPSRVLRVRPRIELVGQTPPQYLKKIPGIVSTLTRNAESVRVPTTIEASEGRYRIVISVDAKDLTDEGTARIRVAFDTFFVPKDMGINEDARQLVMMSPSDGRLLAEGASR